MTETEWLTCSDPFMMVNFLRSSAATSDRKLRLFAVACCRRVWHLLKDERSRHAVEAAERFADGRLPAEDVKAFSEAAIEATWMIEDQQDAQWPVECADGRQHAAAAAEMAVYPLHDGGVWNAGGYGAWSAALDAIAPDEGAARHEEAVCQAALIRGIFGNPFRPVRFDGSWRSSAVLSLAHTIYDQCSFDRLPELADALEKAGCGDTQMLEHLRGPGPHVKGCWAVDLILGKT